MPEFEVRPFKILIEKFEEITAAFIALAPNLLVALILLIITWLVTRLMRTLLNRSFRRARMRRSLKAAIVTLVTVLMWVTGCVLAAMIALPGLTPAKLLAGLGIGSIAIGLAFKDIFENFLAGLLIMLRQPMRIGDTIECEGITGEVRTISIRDTYLRRTDGVLVMIPNAFLYKNPVRVLTDWESRRQSLIVGVAYSEDVAQSRSVIEDAVKGLSTLDEEHPVQVFAKAFSSSSIDFEIAWWAGSSPLDVRASRDQVVEAVKSALDGADIEIPFPYRTLTFKEPLPIRRADSDRVADDPARNDT